MKRPSVRALAVGAVALLVLAGFGWVIARQGPMAPVRVTTASVQAGTLAPTVFGIGTVEARVRTRSARQLPAACLGSWSTRDR